MSGTTTRAVELDHFRDVLDTLGKPVEPGLRVFPGAHGDEHRDPDVEPLRVAQRDLLADHARFAQLLDPAPARRGREVHPRGDVGQRHVGVVLEQCEDGAVFGVHADILRQMRFW